MASAAGSGGRGRGRKLHRRSSTGCGGRGGGQTSGVWGRGSFGLDKTCGEIRAQRLDHERCSCYSSLQRVLRGRGVCTRLRKRVLHQMQTILHKCKRILDVLRAPRATSASVELDTPPTVVHAPSARPSSGRRSTGSSAVTTSTQPDVPCRDGSSARKAKAEEPAELLRAIGDRCLHGSNV